MLNNEFRAYFFTNMYLSSIQKGIQAAHVLAEMHSKYISQHQASYRLQRDILDKWSDQDKTIIVLNGGEGANLLALEKHFQSRWHGYPWAAFCESGLGHALTAVGIILPTIYKEASQKPRSALFLPEELLAFNNESPVDSVQWADAMSNILGSSSLAI